MTLVPHKITALAESDSQGTDGKNIVAGAVVSLFDSSGAAVTLFDDENGSNGSTAKTTDGTGQVVVWVTPGEYRESVNGSTQRAVTIGGRTVTSYPNTESLQNSRPTQTGQRAENRERANAQYELAPQGYMAKYGDILAANGRIWMLIPPPMSVDLTLFGDNVDIQQVVDTYNTVTVSKGYTVTKAIEITSNKNLIGMNGGYIQILGFDNSATTSSGDEFACVKILKNSENVSIRKLGIRGPFYESTPQPAYRSIGVAIEGRYDDYFYNNANYPDSPSVTPTGECKNIEIMKCNISGFGQSGIIADNVNNFRAIGNRITNCARDGIRMYGCVNFDVSENFVEDMTDGFPGEGIAPNNNVYGISATRVYHSTNGDGDTSDYRPSSRGVIARNIVNNCPNWKALDTHGGTDISFLDNVIYNAHIGIGIDKGGFTDSDGYAPPRRLLVKGNIITAGPANAELHRAGVTVFAHDSTANNIGEDITIEGNHIEGFGLDTKDGGIVPSFQDRCNILGNTIVNSLGRCVHFQSTNTNCNVKNNMFANTTETTGGACYGVNVAAADQYVNIDDNIFRQSSNLGDTMIAVGNVTPDPGFGAKVGANNSYIGSVEKSLLPVRLTDDSGVKLQTIAYANVNNNGAATLSSGVGVVSVNRTALGIVDVVLDTEATILIPSVTFKGSDTVGYATFSGSTVTVQTRDLANAFKDTGFYLVVNGY